MEPVTIGILIMSTLCCGLSAVAILAGAVVLIQRSRSSGPAAAPRAAPASSAEGSREASSGSSTPAVAAAPAARPVAVPGPGPASAPVGMGPVGAPPPLRAPPSLGAPSPAPAPPPRPAVGGAPAPSPFAPGPEQPTGTTSRGPFSPPPRLGDSEDAPTTVAGPTSGAAWAGGLRAPAPSHSAVPDPGAEPTTRVPRHLPPAPSAGLSTLPPPPAARSASLDTPELSPGATLIPPDDLADWIAEGDADETMLLVRPDLAKKKRDY